MSKQNELEEQNEKNEKYKRITDEPLATIELSTPFIDASVAKYKKKNKTRKIIIISIAGVLALGYISGIIYSFTHFERNTQINGIDISNKSVSSVNSILENEMYNYKLDVEFKDGNEELSVKNGDIIISLEKSIREVKNTHSAFLWPLYLQGGYSYEVKYITKVNETKMESTINSWEQTSPSNFIKSVNAEVVLRDGEAKIIDDITGTELDIDKLINTCKDYIEDGASKVNIEDNDCYIKADVVSNSDIIKKKFETCDEFINMDAKYDFKGYIVDIPKEELCKMAYLDDNGVIQISYNNVKSYVARFAKQYNTCYTERDFKTHSGYMIKVYGGYYGWEIDEEAETEELYAYLKSKKSFTKAPVCIKEGYAYCDMNDIGNNYVEIDLTNQHVYVYHNGNKVFDTPCVSGCVNRGMSTPGGLYPLTYKTKNATLRGPGYATPVAYWMPFNGGIGMHDATWKSKFGEDYYIYDGSHGCINLPLKAAETIYEYVEQGSPVVCYWENEVGITH